MSYPTTRTNLIEDIKRGMRFRYNTTIHEELLELYYRNKFYITELYIEIDFFSDKDKDELINYNDFLARKYIDDAPFEE